MTRKRTRTRPVRTLSTSVAGCAAVVLGGALPAVAAGGADVVATISGPASPVRPGSTVTFRVTVANNGPDRAPRTVGFIAVDGRSRVDSVTTTAGRCEAARGAIKGFSCAFGTLGAGGDPVMLAVPASVPRKAGRVKASVQVASEAAGLDPDGANNVAEFVTTVR